MDANKAEVAEKQPGSRGLKSTFEAEEASEGEFGAKKGGSR